jgi:RNA-binding protein YlmH
MLDRIAMHFRPSEKPFMQRAEEWIERAYQQTRFQLTHFLNPRQARILEILANTHGEVKVVMYGGTSFAERKRAILSPTFLQPELEDAQLAAIRVTLLQQSTSIKHGDYMGAFLGAGISRDKIGDFFVRPDGCDVVVTEDLVPYWLQNITSVGRVNVEVGEISLQEIQAAPPVFEERTVTVASMRLDAVASEGFRISRTKIADKIRAGLCQLNWQVVSDVSEEVYEGDIISLRGFGRMRVLEVGSVSKKGRQFLKLGKYI